MDDFTNPVSKATIDELLSAARKANKEDRERAELFEGLVRSASWKSYVALLMGRVQAFSDVILQPAGTRDNVLLLEYLKGAMFGLLLARDLPSVTIEAMKTLTPTPIPDEDDVQ